MMAELSLDTTLPGESRFCISLNPSTEWSLAHSLYGSPCGNESQQSEHSPRTHLKALDHFYTSFPQRPPTMAPFPPNFRSPSPGKPYCSCSDLPFDPSPASIDRNVDLHGGSPLSWGNTVPATSPSIMPGGFHCNDNAVDNEAEGRRPQGSTSMATLLYLSSPIPIQGTYCSRFLRIQRLFKGKPAYCSRFPALLPMGGICRHLVRHHCQPSLVLQYSLTGLAKVEPPASPQ